jgi:hypothetical protein
MRISAITWTTEMTSSSVPSFMIWFNMDTSRNVMLVSAETESTSSAINCMSNN